MRKHKFAYTGLWGEDPRISPVLWLIRAETEYGRTVALIDSNGGGWEPPRIAA